MKKELDKKLWIELTEIKEAISNELDQEATASLKKKFRLILKDHYHCFSGINFRRGLDFYRVRKHNPPESNFLSASDLWYPPQSLGLIGNRASTGETHQLYLGSSERIATVECEVRKGEWFSLSRIETVDQINLKILTFGFEGLNNYPIHTKQINYEINVMKSNLSKGEFKKWITLKTFVSKSFIEGNKNIYPWTNFICSIYLNSNVDAIIYPCSKAPEFGYNIAVRAKVADQVFKIGWAGVFERCDSNIIQRYKYPDINSEQFPAPYKNHLFYKTST